MSDEVAAVGGTPEPVLNSGLQMMQMEEHAQLIESKSQMLDEVRSAVTKSTYVRIYCHDDARGNTPIDAVVVTAATGVKNY